MSLKGMFSQFGEVTSCWVPPVEARHKEAAWVKQGGPVHIERPRVPRGFKRAPKRRRLRSPIELLILGLELQIDGNGPRRPP